jgi:hypothetical protein
VKNLAQTSSQDSAIVHLLIPLKLDILTTHPNPQSPAPAITIRLSRALNPKNDEP